MKPSLPVCGLLVFEATVIVQTIVSHPQLHTSLLMWGAIAALAIHATTQERPRARS